MSRLKMKPVVLQAQEGRVTVQRDGHGVPHIRASVFSDALYGLGWVHACDRLLAMELTRLMGQGVAAEKLMGSELLIKSDKVLRRHRLWIDSIEQAEIINPRIMPLVDSYCSGVNNFISNNRLPFEFRLVRHKPMPWTPADCILGLRLMGFVGLGDMQGWAEKFIIRMINQGIPYSKISELFPYIEEDPDPDILEIIKKVRLEYPMVPPDLVPGVIPRFQGSNNWAISGLKTECGKPILCGDPHLETGRLPAVWQEVALKTDDDYFTGCTVPGVPGLALGRTANIAWSPTYACTDISDYFIEEVKDGKYRREDSWLPFEVREEDIGVKGGETITVRFYENDHGILEGEPEEDGYYLCFANAMSGCGADDMESMMELVNKKSVSEAMEYFARLEFGPFNWVLADRGGNIAYQLSGRFPVRKEGASGLLPMPGWDTSFDWRGYRDPCENYSVYNPAEGFICTANNDLNKYGDITMMNVPLSDDRSVRITELLRDRDGHGVDFMKEMHYDLLSKQAEKFMAVIRPLLPVDEKGRFLRKWDCRYDADSTAPTLFERIYRELLKEVFGKNGFGVETVEELLDTTVFPAFYGNFDPVLLAGESSWFGDRSRGDIYRSAIAEGLKDDAPRYGDTRKLMMKNLFFGGRLPRFLGFDYGPIELMGCRSTIPQGQILGARGEREISYSPSYKFIADFSEDGIHSCLPGGPSDRRFSRWYTSGIEEWLEGKYKKLVP